MKPDAAAGLEAAFAYAARGWPVSPWGTDDNRKFPLTPHGHLDATTDPTTITEWFKRFPNALVSIATGERSGGVVLDIDVRLNGSGFDTLEEIGVPFHPETPTAHSPRGGCHLLFAWPGHHVPTTASVIGPFLDVRGDGGSQILPPGPGRLWDPHLNLTTVPLAPMPEWMVIAEPEAARASATHRPAAPLSRYAEAALDGAARRIIGAPAGVQEMTLNAEAFGIGQLAGAGVIPAGVALDALLWAGRRLPSLDPGRPWRAVEVEKKVKAAFTDACANRE